LTWLNKYKSWSSSLCNFLQCPVESASLGQNVFLRTLFSNTFIFYVPPLMSSCERPSFTPS
jgi:hypothetical protein